MLSRNFLKWWVVLFTIVILAVIGSSFILTKQFNRQQASPDSNRAFPSGISSQINSTLKTLYQDPNDKEERTIIYTSDNKNLYNGAGIFNKPGFRTYMIGLFDGWTTIPGTKDRLLALLSPIENSNIGQVRVAFEQNERYRAKSKLTRVSVENLDKAKVMTDDQGSEEYDLWIKDIASLADARLNNLIRIGDALIVFPLQTLTGENWITLKDENNMPYADTILLRRSNGAGDITY